MKLSQTLKKAFIASVMQDVPKVDYLEQAQKCARKHFERLMPAEILQVMQKYPSWFGNNRFYTVGRLPMFYTKSPECNINLLREDVQATEELHQIAEAYDLQEKARDTLEAKLRGVVHGCDTLKQLKEALPEFEKYMPEENQPASQNLPALANIVADFKAAGLQFKTEGAA